MIYFASNYSAAWAPFIMNTIFLCNASSRYIFCICLFGSVRPIININITIAHADSLILILISYDGMYRALELMAFVSEILKVTKAKESSEERELLLSMWQRTLSSAFSIKENLILNEMWSSGNISIYHCENILLLHWYSCQPPKFNNSDLFLNAFIIQGCLFLLKSFVYIMIRWVL